ncbi:MAG: PHP domain-containing protein [Omnitrophica WOR_2 bacterium]
MMREENLFFDAYPRIVRAGRPTAITIRPLYDHVRFTAGKSYDVNIQPCEGKGRPGVEPEHFRLEPTSGSLVFSCLFEAEQEYIISIQPAGSENRIGSAEFRVYALDEDLFSLKPYKGDLHIHSSRSDGLEAPPYVAAACRRIGMDFMAVTDHGQYAPSLEAIQAFDGLDLDLKIYPGEEVHPPQNRVHLINFGGGASINELFAHEAQYRAGVKNLETKLTGIVSEQLRYEYASCLWCFQKIRESGGLAILCHPYWIYNHHYNIPEPLLTCFFEDLPFDAYELIGGYHPWEFESNFLQVGRYQEDRACGKQIPIVGSSDAHGCENRDLFGWYYTVVFARSAGLPDLIAGIKGLNSVAVEALPAQPIRVHGPFRLVKYAYFLLREIFPLHDELCREEGRWMQAFLSGDEAAAGALKKLKGQSIRAFEHIRDARESPMAKHPVRV